MKIIQIENGTLVELVNVFFELTKGFAVPAGTVVLIASASHMAAGIAEYVAVFVQARVLVRRTFTNSIRVLHGVPLLLGGTGNTAAIRLWQK